MFEAIQYKLAQRACEKELARIVDLCEGHKAAGVPTGHAYYSDLYSQVSKALTNLQAAAVKAGATAPDYNTIAVSFPALRTLENLRDGISNSISPMKAVIMALVGGMVLTTLLAMYHDWYMLLTHIGAR